jgi:predicted CXXCH cytochrome family protein
LATIAGKEVAEMKKAALLVVIAGVAAALLTVLGTGTGTASADGGPHVVEAGATPDKCASCHRIHTGQNEYLLKDAGTVEDFCFSCHGNGGPGSDLAVQEGTFYGGITPGAPYGGKPASATLGLRAGGFEAARINTTDAGFEQIGVLALTQPVTSWHTTDGVTAGTMWGNGAINSGAGPSFAMECTSCHDPHGNGQYRILRPIPLGSGAAAGVNVTEQAAPKIYTTTNYFSPGPVSGVEMSNWCSTCHTRYLSSSTASSGDAIYSNRHRSDGSLGTTCVKCHAPHGTNAEMPGAYSSAVPWPGGGVGTTDNNNSRLLKMDNRGICVKCHVGY